ncbi:unnamed protein product [Penicillium camemberti]|uniref:Str. FM013 n=1 Tax=Penicillium camemberti (strain FM 013) TaxID=1429867 RepID=A0A0G4NU52_PENC3|nr:unnamed protein product [Penicillium camemberti]
MEYGVVRTYDLTKITWVIRHESHMYSRCKTWVECGEGHQKYRLRKAPVDLPGD